MLKRNKDILIYRYSPVEGFDKSIMTHIESHTAQENDNSVVFENRLTGVQDTIEGGDYVVVYDKHTVAFYTEEMYFSLVKESKAKLDWIDSVDKNTYTIPVCKLIDGKDIERVGSVDLEFVNIESTSSVPTDVLEDAISNLGKLYAIDDTNAMFPELKIELGEDESITGRQLHDLRKNKDHYEEIVSSSKKPEIICKPGITVESLVAVALDRMIQSTMNRPSLTNKAIINDLTNALLKMENKGS